MSRRLDREHSPNRSAVDGDVRELWEAMNRRSVATQWLLTTSVVCVMLYIASDILVPIVIAGMGYLALRQTVVRLCKLGLPRTLAALGTMLALGAIFVIAGALLYQPARQWMTDAPQSVARVQEKMNRVREPLETVDEASEELKADPREEEVESELDQPELLDSDAVLTETGNALLLIAVIAVTTFFLLATGDDLVNRGLRVLPSKEDRKRALQLASDIQDAVGSYLGHITLINIGLGVAAGLVMWLMGMPTPILWGAIACLFNFVPYIGPLAATGVVFVAAVGAFDSFGRSSLTAGVFWLVTAVEGQLVTPAILGSSLKLGPVVVLLSVAFWGFMWGIPGVFIAVPLVIAARLTFACFEATRPLATLLGSDEDEPPDDDYQQLEDEEEIAEVAGTT